MNQNKKEKLIGLLKDITPEKKTAQEIIELLDDIKTDVEEIKGKNVDLLPILNRVDDVMDMVSNIPTQEYGDHFEDIKTHITKHGHKETDLSNLVKVITELSNEVAVLTSKVTYLENKKPEPQTDYSTHFLGVHKAIKDLSQKIKEPEVSKDDLSALEKRMTASTGTGSMYQDFYEERFLFDGLENTVTLRYQPKRNSLHLFLNGARQSLYTDYDIVGKNITHTLSAAELDGYYLLANYAI